jgi:DNA-binding response OmpR family regulator
MVHPCALVSTPSAVSLYEKAAPTMPLPADILLVEDERDIADFMKRMLRRAGYTVCMVTDGAAAVTTMRLHPPAVMILDLVLPIMSGWAVLDYLHRNQCNVPVIVMTANPTVSARLRGYGIQHSLFKPFLMRELLGALAAVYPAQYHR